MIMKKIITFVIMMVITISSYAQNHLKFTFEVKTICHFNDEYSGVDTNFVLVDGNFVKVWNNYDDRIKIYDSEKDEWRIYLTDYLRNRKIFYIDKDTTDYLITNFNTTDTLLGYRCENVRISSKEDTLFAWVTNNFGVNYSPFAKVDGFVLHYDLRVKHYRYLGAAVNVEKNCTGRIEIPKDYKLTTKERLLSSYNKIFKQQRAKKAIEDRIEIATFPIEDMNGDLFDPETKKGKVLVYNFWAIGCKGCVAEIPELNAVVDHYKNNPDVEFYAFTPDGKSNLVKFLRRKPFKYNVIPNAMRINFLYDINVNPSTVIINAKGKAIRYIRGMVNTKELIDEIDKVLISKTH